MCDTIAVSTYLGLDETVTILIAKIQEILDTFILDCLTVQPFAARILHMMTYKNPSRIWHHSL